MTDDRIVVVGAGLGGLRTAEQLRLVGFTGELLVIGAEPYMPYNRPPLTKEALAAGPTHEAVAFRVRAEAADVRWHLDTKVVTADLRAGLLRLKTGEKVAFDGLVVSTGLRSRRLRLDGPMTGRYWLRTLDDAIALHARLRPGARVLVIGAGFIGCEVAATARALGCEVTVLAPESVPMQLALGVELGAELRRRHEARGVRWMLDSRFVGYTGEQWATGVRLVDGAVVPADVLVEAVGSVPNVDWLPRAEFDLSDGLLCDNTLRAVCTGPGGPPVVAVGDVARFANPLFGPKPARIEHWSVPGYTARRAARTLAAALGATEPDDTPFAPLPTFWSDQFEHRVQSVGRPDLGLDDVRVLHGEWDGEIVLGYHREGRLVGVAGLAKSATVLRHREELLTALSAPTPTAPTPTPP